MKGFENLKVTTVPTTGGSTLHVHHSDPAVFQDKPVLILIHGWPQSKFIYRHMIPRLEQAYRLFVPDLPGYGESTPALQNDKYSVGISMLEAVQKIFDETTIAFVSHDRGARIGQAVASHWAEVSRQFPDLTLLGACLLDIVPVWDQWQTAANPRAAAGYFHWAFLARPEISSPLIKAYGGGKFARDCMKSVCGNNVRGRQLFEADGAPDVYAAYYDRDVTIDAAAADYKAGATDDYDVQVADQASGEDGRKIGVPTLVMYSESKLGRMVGGDVEGLWKKWVQKPEQLLQVVGIGEDVGHYLPEEAPDQVLAAVEPWLAKLSA